MTQDNIIKALDELGRSFEQLTSKSDLVCQTLLHNPWFTPDNQIEALMNWANELRRPKLIDWASNYTFTTSPKKIGLIMAGNIPLVGLHDLVCILMSGHHAMIKPSSDDSILTPWVINKLIEIDQEFKNIIIQTDKLKTCEALIATGSNNSARYFNYYFKDIPKILRKNRNSVAILKGDETLEQLKDLAKDIFMYFGLGCRNVSKIYIPEHYNFEQFFKAIETFNSCIHHNKYFNNYTYHKAIFLMNLTPHLDNGFLIVKEDSALASPLGCLFYEYYTSSKEMHKLLKSREEDLQIVLGDKLFGEDCLPFGQSQNTTLSDFADKVDTMKFLNALDKQD